MRNLVFRILVAGFMLLLCGMVGMGMAETDTGSVRIVRVMTSNRECVLPVNDRYSDWVELQNLSDETVSLKGWKLGKTLDVRGGWRLPDVTLEPKDSVILYCSKKELSRETAAFTTGFSLSSDGVMLVLSDAKGNLREVVQVPEMPSGRVYTLDPDTNGYTVQEPYEPAKVGRDLTAELRPEYDAFSVYISEVMADNKTVYVTEDGASPDWIELYNGTAQDADLTGWSLTDDRNVRRKWYFPDGTVLGSGQYLLILADGVGEGLHTGFHLSAKGETLLLADATGNYVSELTYAELPEDISAIRLSDGRIGLSERPSPGCAVMLDTMVADKEPEEEKKEEEEEEEEKEPLPEYFPEDTTEVPGLYLNEVAVSAKGTNDWVELYNASGADLDLSGYGLSDSEKHPLKWQSPEGTRITAGGYLLVGLVGKSEEEDDGLGQLLSLPVPVDLVKNGAVSGQETQTNGVPVFAVEAPFSLKLNEEELITLSTPTGTVLQRMTLHDQRHGMTYGRVQGCPRYRYFTEPTPGAANSAEHYAMWTDDVVFSEDGGAKSGEVTLTLSCATEGAHIYYTSDGTTPTKESTEYTGPMLIKGNALIKAFACVDDGLASKVIGNTYLIGVKHSVRVICIAGKSSELIGDDGVLVTGNNKVMVDVFAEIYDKDGTKLIGQQCGLRLHGKGSRADFAQKAFHIVAKSEYGPKKFKAKLFTKRDYEEYNSLLIRAAGQDNQDAHMKDPILTRLARNTSVYYQEHEAAVVYVNGKYWGVYYLRERIDGDSIAQFEGSADPDSINMYDATKSAATQGSVDSYYAMLKWVKNADLTDKADMAHLRSVCDVENYLEYVILQMYIGNRDLDNLRTYMDPDDGRWHWILYDTDLSAIKLSDGADQWMSSSGKVGIVTAQSNVLFRRLMKNSEAKAWFLKRFGELLATDFSAASVTASIDELYSEIQPEMRAECERWSWGYDHWEGKVKKLKNYFTERPAVMIKSLVSEFDLSAAQKEEYFGAALALIGG